MGKIKSLNGGDYFNGYFDDFSDYVNGNDSGSSGNRGDDGGRRMEKRRRKRVIFSFSKPKRVVLESDNRFILEKREKRSHSVAWRRCRIITLLWWSILW